MLGENQPHLRMIDAALLEELCTIATRSVEGGGSDELSRLKKRLRDAEALLAQKDAEIAELSRRLELVSTLRVELPDQALALPDTMHVERATVGQVHASMPAVSHVIESTSGVREIAAPGADARPIPLNEGKLKALQIWFERKTTLHQHRMLKVLYEQGKPMDVYEISSWSGDAESMIKNQPPLELVQHGILSRTMVHRRGYRYILTLKTFLMKEFPGTNQQALIEHVLSWCR